MARCYSGPMPKRQSGKRKDLPDIWLLTDARNDAVLVRVMAAMPRSCGVIFRHYHLPLAERLARFAQLKRVAKRRGHWLVLAGSARAARLWGADGAYGSARQLAAGPALLRLVTAHNLRELAVSRRADALLLSPVFPTRSHPDANAMGALRFKCLAAQIPLPVIALGGMNGRRAKGWKLQKWAAIDGICDEANRWNCKDS